MSTDPLLGKHPMVKRPGFIGSIINRVKPLNHEAGRKKNLVRALKDNKIDEALRIIKESGLTGHDFDELGMGRDGGKENIIPYIISMRNIYKYEDAFALIKALLDKGIDTSKIVRSYYHKGTNSWFILQTNNYHIVKLLVDHREKIGEKIMYDNDEFLQDLKHLPITLYVFVEKGLNVNRIMKNGDTPFLYMLKAVVSMENDIMEGKRRSEYVYKDMKLKMPFYYDVLKLMIEKGANVNESAMDIARNLEDKEFVDFLNKEAHVNEVKVNPNANGNAKATNPANPKATNHANANGNNYDGQLPGAVNGGKRRKTRKSTKSRKLRSRKFKKSRKLRSRKSKI